MSDQTPTCDPGSGTIESVAGGGDYAGGVLPDTDSLARTGRVIFANALPLGLLAALGLFGGWLVRRRRQDAELELEPIYVDAADEEEVK